MDAVIRTMQHKLQLNKNKTNVLMVLGLLKIKYTRLRCGPFDHSGVTRGKKSKV